MQSSRSLRTRAVMALLLMVGFYVFALAIVAILLWVPYAEFTYMERVNSGGSRLAIFCIVGALTILWALVPRIDKFEPPGPRLTPATAPQLFTMINDVAAKTSQMRPEEVYLLNDVNAFVSQRGGVMGFGSKRVMGIGLPLINGLSAAELRSVIGHEFGHYVSGDVALGPWIWKTRATIARTLHALGNNWLLTKVFEWYALMFMRMTMQVSREQEFVADATAAKVAGPEPTITALGRVDVIASAYAAYMHNEVMPVLGAGFLPPVSEGFSQYLNDPETHQAFQSFAQEASVDAESSEFDTHPPMKERIAAIEQLKPRRKPGGAEEVAPVERLLLLKDPDRHARALLEHNFGKDNIVKLKTIGWSEVGALVYAQMWQRNTTEHAKWLSTLNADQIPSNKKWFKDTGERLAKNHPNVPVEYHSEFAMHVLACAIGNALLTKGWTIQTAIGKPILVIKDAETFNPRESIMKLADESMTADEWKATCASLALGNLGPQSPETQKHRITEAV